ncbi:hypothetical protein HY214_01300 [Candidatus Roizmanbacteria bacterium]|nr:hypothetical protein [Candidatus Roizmanbacteria bacterium]
MAKLWPNKQSLIRFLIIIFVIGIASIIPIIQTYGKLNISYDTFIPPIPENSFKMGFQWIDTLNGNYISNSYFIWLGILAGLKKIGLDIYQASFTLQFFIFFLSGLGVYNIFNLFNNKNRLYGLVSAVFFIYSPHLLDFLIYYTGTIGIVWTLYVFLKFIKRKQFDTLDPVIIALSLGIINDLPNPKYHFLLFIALLTLIGFSLLLKILTVRDLKKNATSFFFIILTTLFISVPFLYYGYTLSKGHGLHINIRKNYKTTGEALDYGVATTDKMIKLFHTPNLTNRNAILVTNPFSIFTYYLVPLLVLGLFPFLFSALKSNKKFGLLLYIHALLFVFISKGTNPPFGFLYEYILSSSAFFAFLRTTAGIIIFSGVFYALIYGLIYQLIAEKKTDIRRLRLVLLSIILINGYVFWSGEFFTNHEVGSSINLKEHGIKIPSDYFTSASFIKKLKLDSKIDIYPKATNYQNNNWGYFGFINYPWIYDKPTVSFDKTTLDGQISSTTNSNYIINDKSLELGIDPKRFLKKPEKKIFSSKIIDIYRVGYNLYLPHIYIPKSIEFKKALTAADLFELSSGQLAFMAKNELASAKQIINYSSASTPIVEYKKINPTKYIIRIHQARQTFPLVFLENMHPEWRLTVNQSKKSAFAANDTPFIGNYEVHPENLDDQANLEEITDYFKNGWLSLPVNASQIQFVSKKVKGTIQNDNLSDNSTENFFSRYKIPETQHLQANFYANSWIMNPTEICSQINCKINPDQSYDLNLVLEFFPQRIANTTYFISIITILLIVCSFVIKKFKMFLND